jgi:hypothetical protein
MCQQIERRLAELQAELAEGQRRLAELETMEKALREGQLRRSGAIRMLEELLRAIPASNEQQRIPTEPSQKIALSGAVEV